MKKFFPVVQKTSPMIYMVIFITPAGDTFTGWELNSILKHMLEYWSGADPDFAIQVDSHYEGGNWKIEQTENGSRRYHVFDAVARSDFTKGLYECRLKGRAKAVLDEPLRHPVAYVGWTTKPANRKTQHLIQQESRKPLMLMDVIQKILLKDKFNETWVPIATCWRDQMPQIAEVFFTRLALSWRTSGGYVGQRSYE